MIKAAFSVVRMAPLRTLQALRMNTESAVEIGRAFEFQYNAQVPEQNTNILYVENWVPVSNRQFTELSKRPKSGCAIASHLPAVPDGLAFKNILMGPMAIHSVSPSNSGENDSKFRNA
ncbi:hypothetical protein T11_10364 [Trichinella zimbabwensis]|uniref:Uncharacterized protein n=1 Tax=Trichinella zimbabwensis TaxID=268475 RepID=A0A0V1HI85_9BILA|nr:hypothetical protein T11_10364 [Trichinella zimbabwensis]